MSLNTTQMTTVLNVLTTFLNKREAFTVENVVAAIEKQEDVLNGFYDENGDSLIESKIDEISIVIELIITNFYTEVKSYCDKIYTFKERKIVEQEFDQEIELTDEDFALPSQTNLSAINDGSVYVDNEDEDYSDHSITYELKIDKQKRIYIKPSIFKDAGWDMNEKIIIVGCDKNSNVFYILRYKDKLAENFGLEKDEYIFNSYDLQNGSIRFSVANLLPDIQAGDIMYAKIIWSTKNSNYIEVCTSI